MMFNTARILCTMHWKLRVKIGGKNIDNIRFAGDRTVSSPPTIA